MVPNHKTVYVLQYVMLGLHFKHLASIGQHFKELIQDFEGSCPVRKNWLVMQDYIPLSPCLCLSLILFILFSSCLWQRFWHMFGQSPWNRYILHMMNKTLTIKALWDSPYWLRSLRLIKQLIMMSNFPLRLIEMISFSYKTVGWGFQGFT